MNEINNYEKSLLRLEEIVKTLESGELALEEAVKLYNEGTQLSESCRKALQEAQLTVKVVDEQE